MRIVKSPSFITFCFPANELVIVVEKFASSPNADASSFNVSNVSEHISNLLFQFLQKKTNV